MELTVNDMRKGFLMRRYYIKDWIREYRCLEFYEITCYNGPSLITYRVRGNDMDSFHITIR